MKIKEGGIVREREGRRRRRLKRKRYKLRNGKRMYR